MPPLQFECPGRSLQSELLADLGGTAAGILLDEPVVEPTSVDGGGENGDVEVLAVGVAMVGDNKRTVEDVVSTAVEFSEEPLYHIALEGHTLSSAVNISYLLRILHAHGDDNVVAHRAVGVGHRQPVVGLLLGRGPFSGLIEVEHLTALFDSARR